MNTLNQMRLGVLREIKNVRKLLDNIERSVKTKNPESIQRGYVFLVNLAQEMNEGVLSPNNLKLDLELSKLLQDEQRGFKE